MKRATIKRAVFRLISVAVSICLLSPSALGISVDGSMIMAGHAETPAFLQVEVPESLARIDEMYEAPPSVQSKLVLHIQTIHGNYETQMKIKKLLEYLHDTYGFKLLLLEGASDKLNAKNIQVFPDEENNRNLAELLAQKGELTGGELFYLEHQDTAEAVGIENPQLYRKNYELYREIKDHEGDLNRFLTLMNSRLMTLNSRTFSPDLRRVLSEWQKFSAGHREFLPFVNGLGKDAKKYLDIDLESIFAQVQWPQLTRLLVIQSMEKELNPARAKTETAELISFLESKQIDPELIDGIKQLGKRKISMARVTANDPRIQYLPRYLLERLVDTAGPLGFRFQDYPAFSVHAGYLILQSEIQSSLLFEEIEKLFDSLLNTLAVTQVEKDLLELYRDGELLSDLFHLELTRKKWERAVYRRDWLNPQAMMRRLENVQFSGAAGEKQSVAGFRSKSIQNYFMTAFRFYDFARARENAFYESMIREMDSRQLDKAILITGGFHTDGISEMFREGGINYGILSPVVSGTPDTGHYASIMSGKQQTLFDLATLEIPLLLGRLAMDGLNASRAKSIFGEIVKVAQTISPEERRAVFENINELGLGGLFNGSVVEVEAGSDQWRILFSLLESYLLGFHAGKPTLKKMLGAQVLKNMGGVTASTPRVAVTAGEIPGTANELPRNRSRVDGLVEQLRQTALPAGAKPEQPGEIGSTAVLEKLNIPPEQAGVTFPKMRLSESTVQGPGSYMVFRLAGGIAAPGSGVDGISQQITKTGIGQGNVVAGLEAMLEKDSRLELLGALLSVMDTIPSDEEIRGLGFLLRQNVGEQMRILVVMDHLSQEDVNRASNAVRSVQAMRDAKGNEIGKRLDIQFVQLPDVREATIMKQLSRTVRSLANDLHQALRAVDSKITIGDYLVIVMDEGIELRIDRDLIAGLPVVSSVSRDYAAGKNYISMKLSQVNGKVADLLKENIGEGILRGKRPGEYLITDASIASLLSLVQAVRELVAASA